MKVIHIISDLGLGKDAIVEMVSRSEFSMAVDISLKNLDMHFKYSKYDQDMMPYCIALYGKLHLNAVNGVLRRVKSSIFNQTRTVGLQLSCKTKDITEYFNDISEIR